MLYLAQMSKAMSAPSILQDCIDEYNDCFYGDGVRWSLRAVAAGRGLQEPRRDGKKRSICFNEIKTKYADAIDHNGNLLVDSFGERLYRPANKSAEAVS